MSSRWRRMIRLGIVALVGGGIGAGIWVDRTSTAQFAPQPKPGCHDAFRLVSPTASGVDSVINIVPMITPQEWPDLQAVFRQYAKQYGWSDRDISKNMPGIYQRIYVDICSEHSNISVNSIIWNADPPSLDFEKKEVQIYMYTNAPERTWQTQARQFVEALEAKWPGRVKFYGTGGELIKPPAYLQLEPKFSVR